MSGDRRVRVRGVALGRKWRPDGASLGMAARGKRKLRVKGMIRVDGRQEKGR